MEKNVDILCKKLAYTFTNRDLIKEALRHRSFHGDKNNERLEFLGDAVLNLIISQALFKNNLNAKEGKLSQMRANRVRAETLVALAELFQLSDYLFLGPGELKGGASPSILADAMEAVIGAIYMDSSLSICAEHVLRWYETLRIETKIPKNLKDYKSQLQEFLQARNLPLPNYSILEIKGLAHAQKFYMECTLSGLNLKSHSEGTSRRQAEQIAAKEMLFLIKEKN